MLCFADQLQPSRLQSLASRLYETTRTGYFQDTSVIHFNSMLLARLGYTQRAFITGNYLPHMQAISTVYAGHQFGVYTSKLGDGRVHILGDLIACDDSRWEVQFKGAGATPFARGNSGRMTLAEAMTEYLGCEAMAGLGIASTRGLALIRYAEKSEGGQGSDCILVRTAPSHLRFGHFEYLHNQQDKPLLKELADHVIAQHYSELLSQTDARRYLLFLLAVTRRTAGLLAQWQAVGFVHSVMNTDNMSILGLTLDYGVYGYMQAYDPTYSPNPSDDQHRYAFDQQVDVARWNCLALAEALIDLLPEQRIPASLLQHFRQAYSESWAVLMHKKLGLNGRQPGDAELVAGLLKLLRQHRVDYTRFFRGLCYVGRLGNAAIGDLLPVRAAGFQSWFDNYRQRLTLESTSTQEREAGMRAINPRYVLRQEWLEQAITRAEQAQDFGLLQDMLEVLHAPYADHEKYTYLA